MKELDDTTLKEMIVIPLEEYKELLRCQGKVDTLEHQINLSNETLNNHIRLYCTLALHPDANV